MEDVERLRQLEARLADLRARMPKHTVRPAMMMEMEDLEEEVETLRASIQKGTTDAQGTA